MSRRLLRQLGLKYPTDKVRTHAFHIPYANHFARIRRRSLTILELGIGEESYGLGGGSLMMWRDYFVNSRIIGVDLWDKSPLDGDRIQTIVGDCSDPDFLAGLVRDHGPFDVVIDDASHMASQTLKSLFVLLHAVRPGGYYVVEDTQTSYWPTHEGTSLAINAIDTPVAWFKHSIDIINRRFITDPRHWPLRAGFPLTAMHVYENICFLQVGDSEAEFPLPTKTLKDMAAMDLAAFGDLQATVETFEADRIRYFREPPRQP